MKVFNNRSKNNKEKAIKIGSNVPADAANIAMFDQDIITAGNSLLVMDVSESIPENKVKDFGQNKIYFANELGILEDENGNSRLPTQDVSISDIPFSDQYSTELISSVDPNNFLHSYYVSRHFCYGQRGFSISSMLDIPLADHYSTLNIRVVDQNNFDYIDLATGRKKYKILLEPYLTDENYLDTEVPHKIFVGFDATPAKNLKLVYDKIEVNSEGQTSNLFLSFTENINAVPYFSEIAEESLLMDSNVIEKNKYSIKKFLQKYSEIYKQSMDTTGFQAFVPRKALADNRVFEVFNWRLIAKSNQSVNLDQIQELEAREYSANVEVKTIKVGVLYDSKDPNKDTVSNAVIKPYIFYRLQSSPFNFSGYNFVNPISESLSIIPSKSQAIYWKVNIQSVEDLSQFDVLAFSPTEALSEKAIRLIDKFVTKDNGTLLVDASKYPDSIPFYKNNITLTALDNSATTYVEYNTDSNILNENKNGGWNIDDSIFEKPNYGIFGLKNTNGYRYINSVDSTLSILNIGPNQANKKSVAALYEFNSQRRCCSTRKHNNYKL
jgi:hypothetical protein